MTIAPHGIDIFLAKYLAIKARFRKKDEDHVVCNTFINNVSDECFLQGF
jgi:hypothetical protein